MVTADDKLFVESCICMAVTRRISATYAQWQIFWIWQHDLYLLYQNAQCILFAA